LPTLCKPACFRSGGCVGRGDGNEGGGNQPIFAQRAFCEAGTRLARSDEFSRKREDAGRQGLGGFDEGFLQRVFQVRVDVGNLAEGFRFGASLGGRGARGGQRIHADGIAEEVGLVRFGIWAGRCGLGFGRRCSGVELGWCDD
jgi:hypothetical protein